MQKLLLLITLFSLGFAVPVNAQEEDKKRNVKGLKIDDALFKNTILTPDQLRSFLNDRFLDNVKESVFEAMQYADHLRSESNYEGTLKVGDYVSFKIVDSSFIIRVLAADQRQEMLNLAPDELPNDLKAKQTFKVTKMTAYCVLVEDGATKISIPVERIMYFQQGLAPMFR